MIRSRKVYIKAELLRQGLEIILPPELPDGDRNCFHLLKFPGGGAPPLKFRLLSCLRQIGVLIRFSEKPEGILPVVPSV